MRARCRLGGRGPAERKGEAADMREGAAGDLAAGNLAAASGILPRGFLPVAVLGLGFLLLPLVVIFSRVQWADLGQLLAGEGARAALALSLRTCLAAVVLCVVLGVPISLVLAVYAGRPWARALRLVTLLPMALPPVVAGLALLYTWGRRGLLGAGLQVAGISIPFTEAAVVLAQAFVALPFFVATLEATLRERGFLHEVAALSLGASPGQVFRWVTWPLARPGLVVAVSLAAARCLGEFGATITFAGSLQGVTRTLPLEIYLQREVDSATALALAAVLIMLALGILAAGHALARLLTPTPKPSLP